MALRPLFFFQQAQYAQVFPLKSTPFCKLFGGLGSTNKSGISLLFFYLTPVLSSLLCPLLHLFFNLNLSGKSGRNCLLSLSALSGYNGSPDTGFSRVATRLISWPDGEHYSCPQQSLVVLFSYLSYPFLSLSYPLSDQRRTVSSKFFDTQVSSTSTEKLVLPRHAHCE